LIFSTAFTFSSGITSVQMSAVILIFIY
jgi:hypothetical protein